MTTTQNTPHDHSISTFIGTQPDTERDAYLGCHVPPSLVYWRDGVSVFCWALDAPVSCDDLRVSALLDFFGMETPNEPLPSPDDGWEVLRDDPATYTVDHLHTKYIEEAPAEPLEEDVCLGMYGDAKIITPFNEDDYDGRLITVTIGSNQFSKAWKPQQLPLNGLIHQFTKSAIGPKDGLAVVLADMVPGQRIKKAVKTCTAIGLDIDNGVPTKVIDDALAKLGCLAIRATTHSNGKQSSEISKDEILKYHEGSPEITSEMIQQFLLMKKHWDQGIVDTIEFVEEDHTDKGIVCRISHAPMEKHRVIVPLEEPYVIADEGRTQMEAMAKWAKVPAALAEKLGVPFDRSCTDPSRLYYLARHDKGRPFSISLFGGPLFKRSALQLGSVFDKLEAEFAKSGGSKSVTPWGKNHGRWWMTYAHGFQIMDVIEHHCPDRKRSKASAGYNIECPFDSDHSNAGDTQDQACFAVNAAETGGNEFFVVKCQHAGCQDKTALDMLGKMIEEEWFPESEITNPDFNIAEIEEAPKAGMAVIAPSNDAVDKAIAGLKAPLKPRDVTAILAKIAIKAASATQERIWLDAIVKASAKALNFMSLKTDLKQIKAEAKKSAIIANEGHTSLINLLSEELGHDFVIPCADHGEFHLARGDEGHVWAHFDTGEGPAPAYFTPFDVVGDVRNKTDGTRAIRIRVRDRENVWGEVDVPVSMLARSSGNEAIAILQDAGLLVRKKGREFLVEYLSSVKRREINVVSKSGWYDDFFMCPTGQVVPPDMEVELIQKARIKGKARKGSLEEWKKEAAWLFGVPSARHWQWAFVSGIAGCVAGLLDDEPLAYYLTGGAKMGKSPLQEGQASNWAIGSLEKGGLFTTARGTETSMEINLSIGSGTYTGFDEARHIPPALLENTLFTVQSGAGKKRGKRDGGGNRDTVVWRGGTITFSDEWTLRQRLATANIVPAAGSTGRVACIVYKEADRLSKADYNKHIVVMKDNYGWSGPALVQSLFDKGHVADNSKIRTNLARLVSKLTKGCEADLELHEKAARFAAYIGVTADLMKEAGLIPDAFASDDLAEWVWKHMLASDMAPQNAATSSLAILKSELGSRKGIDVVDYAKREDYKSRPAVAYFNAWVGKAKMFVVLAGKLTELGGSAASRAMMLDALEAEGALIRSMNTKAERTWGDFPGLPRTQYVVIRADWVEAEGSADATEAAILDFRADSGGGNEG